MELEDLGIIGKSRPLLEAAAKAERVSHLDAPVLLSGETGTGKELFARAIHVWSGRPGPFHAVNVSSIPHDLAPSELFGSIKGAHSTAVSDREGAFQRASGGTLLLDEVGDMDRGAQSALLRVLDTGSVLPLGADSPREIDVKVIGSTNRNLRDMVHAGLFREDLFYRLSAYALTIPPLRARGGDDVELLADHFLRQLETEIGIGSLELSADAAAWLRSQPLPGNVRELQNILRSAAVNV